MWAGCTVVHTQANLSALSKGTQEGEHTVWGRRWRRTVSVGLPPINFRAFHDCLDTPGGYLLLCSNLVQALDLDRSKANF